MSRLDEQRYGDAERDLFVLALVGVASKAARWRRFIEDRLAGGPGGQSTALPPAPVDPARERAIYAILGLASMLDRLSSLLRAWSQEAPLGLASSPRTSPPLSRGLLR